MPQLKDATNVGSQHISTQRMDAEHDDIRFSVVSLSDVTLGVVMPVVIMVSVPAPYVALKREH
jgi:hypothetical protein